MRTNYKKQANYKDSFEDLYLRHDYLKKIKLHDLKGLEKYEPIAKATARIMYDKQRMTFNKVSFFYEDIVNITRVYMTSFLGSYSFAIQPDKLEKFKASFLKRKGILPTQEEIDRKERNNLINFLRQRLSTCAVSCERKSRNIVASRGVKVYYAHTARSLPAPEEMISEDPGLYGYRLIPADELKAIKAKCGKKSNLVDEQGFQIIVVESYSAMPTSLYMYNTERGAEDQELNEVNHERLESSIEDRMIDDEDDIYLEALKDKFSGFSDDHRKKVLVNFVNQNKDNQNLSGELRLARKMIKSFENAI